MEAEEFKKFREKYFKGKLSQERMAVDFGVKYNTLRRYEGNNPMPIPEVLAKSIGFFIECKQLKGE